MIRPTTAADLPRLLALTAGTGLFSDYDLETLEGVLGDYLEGDPAENEEAGHVCVTAELDGAAAGYLYYAEAEYADRVWYVWWVAVDKVAQGRGVGRELLGHAETDARRRGGRLMLIETSGRADYEPTRGFYLKAGYEREAVLRDYYRDGDDKVVFRKRLGP